MGGNISEIIRAAGNRLRLVHVADTMDHRRSHGLRYITNPARVHQHLKIGDGDVDGTSSSADSPRSTSTTGPTP
jgi:myo-inositol catabolism protein IolH